MKYREGSCIFSHIGLSVTDLDKALEFYTKVLGWYVIMPPTEILSDDTAIGIMYNDVFGEGWGSFRMAHLSTSDKIGIEIFEFNNAEQRENNFTPFGNLIEIYSHSYELTYSAGACQDKL